MEGWFLQESEIEITLALQMIFLLREIEGWFIQESEIEITLAFVRRRRFEDFGAKKARLLSQWNRSQNQQKQQQTEVITLL